MKSQQDPSTETIDVDDTDRAFVTALLVVRSESSSTTTAALTSQLDATTAALAAQTRRPDRLVVVDATADRMMRDYLDARAEFDTVYPRVSVVVAPADASFAAIVDDAVDALPAPGEDLVVPRRPAERAGRRPVRARDSRHWLWLLHEDSAPDADALAELTATTAMSSRVGIAGCKVVDSVDPRILLDIGTGVTRTGRHASGARGVEPDQGQYDDRRDVLSVSSAGMLVRQSTYNELGGFDPAFDGDGDGLDLGWRAHLIGHSVVVVPGARVRQVATHSGVDARTRRRHRQVALARVSLPGLPFLALWTTFSSLLLALALLLAKRPRPAGAEFVQSTAVFGVLRILGARRRFFRRATTRRRDLGGLFVGAFSAALAEYDSLHDAVVAGTRSSDDPESLQEAADPVSNETGPVEADSEELRVERGPVARTVFGPAGLVGLLLVVASAVFWRDLLTGGAFTGTGRGLVGGQLLPFETDATGVWRTYRDAWTGPGLGHPSTPAPYLAILAPLVALVGLLPWVQGGDAGGVTIAWLMLAAMPLSGLVAYRAGRAVTLARWPRVVVALLWGTVPTLTTAIAQGRLGPVLAHIVLPFAVAGLLMTARRAPGAVLTFATVLAVTMLGAFSPVLLIATSLMAAVGVVFAPGYGRLRQLALLVLPWLLIAPWTREVITGDHRLLLGGPGVLDASRGTLARPWELALLHPGGPGSYAVLASVPVLALAVLGLFRSNLGRAGAALIAVAGLGLAGALAASHVLLESTDQGPVTPWSGSALDLYTVALVGAGLLGLAALDRGRSARQAAGVTALACAGSVVVGGFAVGSATPTSLSTSGQGLPAVVQRQLFSPNAPRALVLTDAVDGSVGYRLVGREAGLPARDLRSPYPSTGQRTAAAVKAVSTTGTATQGATLLRGLAVGYVVVQGPTAVRGVDRAFSTSGGLTRLAKTPAMTMWRVETSSGTDQSVPVSRLTIDSAGQPIRALPSQAQHGRAAVSLPPGPDGRTLVLSEGADWIDRGRVTLDGRLLSAAVVGGSPSYALPTNGGSLAVEPGVVNHRLPWLQLTLLILCVYLAVPFGTRRPRPKSLGAP